MIPGTTRIGRGVACLRHATDGGAIADPFATALGAPCQSRIESRAGDCASPARPARSIALALAFRALAVLVLLAWFGIALAIRDGAAADHGGDRTPTAATAAPGNDARVFPSFERNENDA